jgi:hypothetical protein
VGSNPDHVKPKIINFVIFCFSGKQASLRSKSKNWLAQNQDNVLEWSDMSTRRPNNLSLVCLYLSLYIFFLICGHFFFFVFFLKHSVQKKNVQIIIRKYIMTNIDTQETDYSV